MLKVRRCNRVLVGLDLSGVVIQRCETAGLVGGPMTEFMPNQEAVEQLVEQPPRRLAREILRSPLREEALDGRRQRLPTADDQSPLIPIVGNDGRRAEHSYSGFELKRPGFSGGGFV